MVCNCTVSRFNAEILPDIAEYAAGAGFDELHFEYAGQFDRDLVAGSRIEGVVPEPHYLKGDTSILADFPQAVRIKKSLKEIKERYRNSNLSIATTNIDLLSVENLHQGTIPHSKCYVERNVATVNPRGELVPCAFINNYAMGNLVGGSFRANWNNASHRNFRKLQNSGGLPMCSTCILGVQWNLGVAKSMKKIYLTRILPGISRLRAQS
jgi:MoaA/NifB/PqqE/SkfB family radical SAM enzyme